MFNKESYTRVPNEMKELKRWVLWKKMERDGKSTKIPLNAVSGKGAKSNDESTWATFEEACKGLRKFGADGLGFMLGLGYFGIDIDHALDNKELISEFVDTLNSYTEISQSGEGIHIICKGVLPVGNRRKGNIEMYDNARFFALTGNVYENKANLAERTEEVKALHEKYLAPSYTFKKESQNEVATRQTYTLMQSDEDILSKALSSKNSIVFSSLFYGQWEGAYSSQSNADLALCSFLAFWTNKDASQIDRIFRKSKLYREKWDEKHGEHTYGEITIQKAIATCQNTYNPQQGNPTTIAYNPETGEYYTPKKTYDYSDTGNARRFVDTYKDLIRYNFDNKTWIVWNGKTWVKDQTQKVKNLADKMIKEMQKEYFDIYENDKDKAEALLKNIKHLSSSSGKEAMLKEALHLNEVATTNKDYDKDIYLLNCNNGVVNLRTGELMPHDRKLMLSKNTNIDVYMEKDEPKTWVKALKDIFQNDDGVVEFVRRAVGYTLTGDTKEQCFFQCHGNGANGKSVFLNTLNSILGDYAINAQVESILTRGNNNSGNASPDIARMNGARFVRTNEPNEGARFNEGLVKQLTGGNDKITARFLYGTDFEFQPVFKLWIACNYKIGVRGTDKGIWRRMRLIPFEAEFEGKNDDKNLESKIKEELPKILRWAINGCLEWQKEGLPMPQKIEDATKEYRDEMDIIRSFCKDCVKMRPESKTRASEMFNAYKRWAMQGNERMMSQSKFGIEMGKKFKKQNINGYMYYIRCELKATDEQTYVFDKEDYE